MYRQSARRRVRKRKCRNQNNRMKFGVYFGIILLAVFLGFLTARFAVGPIIGYDADESPAKIAEGSAESEEKKTSGDSLQKSGYALQFGAFSSEGAARELSESLKRQGVQTEIVKIENMYKVISPVTASKEEALHALNALPEMDAEDVFITSFSESS